MPEMKIFLIIFLASGLASSEKLDRSYLPPPGSKFSGGSPGDLETPLEFPKQSTGPQPTISDIELGIDQRPGPPKKLDGQKPGFNYFQNSYPIPKTTTSYAITQTTTFAPPEDYEAIDQPNVYVNGSTVQELPGQIYRQPIRGPGQGSSNQYRPGQGQISTAPYGTPVRPQFPGTVYTGPEYLPPVSNKRPGQVILNQDGSGYPSGLPEVPTYQHGQVFGNQPGYVPRFNQQNQYIGNQTPSTVVPQYQGGRFVPIRPGSQDSQNQFPGSQFPASPTAPQYQAGQPLTTPGNQQNQFTGNQFQTSTTAPQYQAGQSFTSPGSNQQNQFLGNKEFPSSTATPQYQYGQRFTTPGLTQQTGSGLPNQQNQFTRNQYQGNQNFPSSTLAPTLGSIEQNQFSGNQNYPLTASPNFQDGQRYTTSGQGGLIPGQQTTGSNVPGQNQNQFAGQNFPTSTVAPQFQDGLRVTTSGYTQEGSELGLSQQKQNQYPENQNYPSSSIAPQYQNGQQFITPGPDNQNFPSTVAPIYQGGQQFTTPGQYSGQYGPDQQITGSRLPGQQNQATVSQNYPSSTAAPQYQEGQRFSTPGTQFNQQSQYPGNQNFPTSTIAPQYQDGQQRFTSPGSEQTFGSPQQNQNQFGNQNYPSSTTSPQYQGQRVTSGQPFHQPSYPGSTVAPQYQQTLAPTPGTNQPLPNQQGQFNQQFPSSTVAPQRFIPESQPQYGTNNVPMPGTEVAFPQSQGRPGTQIYGSTQQPQSQTGASFIPSSFPNQGFPSTTVGSLPARDFASTPGFGTIAEARPDRPQAETDRNAEILNYENVLTPEGYFYSYDTSNGIHADETGTVGNGTRAQGGYSYIGDDGKVYSVVYSADENGFQPRGDHLPTPPPIPEAIQRVIDQANMDKDSGIDDDGSYNEAKYGYMKYEGPLSRFRTQNITTSLVNGVDIPDTRVNRVSEQKKKTSKPKVGRPGLDTEDDEEIELDLEETDITGSETGEIEDDRRDDVNVDKSMKPNRRISSKRPKPIQNLIVEDIGSNRLKEAKTPMTPTATQTDSSVIKMFDRNSSNRRPMSSGNNEESSSDDIPQESEDNDDLQESEGVDYDLDLINYKDDPNNRTNFHGLNKYLPDSKQGNRKSQSSKKRVMVRVKGMKKPAEFDVVETSEDFNEQGSQDNKPGFVDETRKRIPSRKYKPGQKIRGMSKITGQTTPGDTDDEINSYGDGSIDTEEEYVSEDVAKQINNDRVSKPGTSQIKNNISGKPKRPNVNDSTVSGIKESIKSSQSDENGYEYNPPQRKFEESVKVPSRTSNQKGTQTTIRPFMTKNVYGDENEPEEEYNGQFDVKPGRPSRPMAGQKQYPGYSVDGNRYNQNNPEVNEDERYSTTRRPISYGTTRRPFGTQSTETPQYQQQGTTGQVFNEPTIQTQRPGDNVYYTTNAPTRGTPGIISSTTPLPPSGQDSFNYRPGQDQNKPVGGSYYETSSPGEPRGANRPSGQVPSTTYRPNYSFGDKISSPVTVDGFGRPILSTNAPAFDRTLRPTYSTVKPSGIDRLRDMGNQFRPTEGRFGSTQTPPGYQSTSAPGEDFSGPKQPQRFDSETGYHYK